MTLWQQESPRLQAGEDVNDSIGRLRHAIAFHPEQIASSISSNGSYDVDKPNIIDQKSGCAIEALQWLKTVKNKVQPHV